MGGGGGIWAGVYSVCVWVGGVCIGRLGDINNIHFVNQLSRLYFNMFFQPS